MNDMENDWQAVVVNVIVFCFLFFLSFFLSFHLLSFYVFDIDDVVVNVVAIIGGTMFELW